MNMVVAFDTLAYANRLKDVGVESKIAETQAEIHAKVLHDLMQEKLATKDDLKHLKNALSFEINGVKKETVEIREEMHELRTELRSEMDEFRTELRGEMNEFRAELRSEMNGLRNEMSEFKGELRGEMGELRGEMGGLRGEMGGLRGEMGELRGEMGKLKSDILLKMGGMFVACTAVLGSLTAVFSYIH